MTLSEFMDLPWSDSTRQQLQAHMARGQAVAYGARRSPTGKLVATIYSELPDDLEDVYIPGPSRTQQAINLIDSHGMTAYQACKLVGVSQAAVSRARRKKCSHCGR